MFIFLEIFGEEHKFETCFFFSWEIFLQSTFDDNFFDFLK
jgi:hypothetical protein